jgi:hypothetical protein
MWLRSLDDVKLRREDYGNVSVQEVCARLSISQRLLSGLAVHRQLPIFLSCV